MARPKRDAKKTTTRRRPRRLTPARHSLAKQSAAVLALGLGLTAGAPAEASIVYTDLGPAGYTFSNGILGFLDYPGDGNMFQIVHGGYSSPTYVINNAAIAYESSNYGKAFVAASLYNFAILLNAGEQISGSLSWNGSGGLASFRDNNGNTYKYGYFLGNKGYAGLRFDPGDGAHYGWAEISTPDDAASVTLYGYAYETEVDAPINAGQVPLPSSLLLLGSGAAGLLAYRRRRRAA